MFVNYQLPFRCRCLELVVLGLSGYEQMISISFTAIEEKNRNNGKELEKKERID